MVVHVGKENLPFFEALASGVRLQILEHLCQQPQNVKELAAKLSLSSAIVSMHVKKLEEAGLIKTQYLTRAGSRQKLCTALPAEYRLAFDRVLPLERMVKNFSLPVGQYTDCACQPTCGLADLSKVIGALDNPASFFEPQRALAQIVWLTAGHLEYTLPGSPPQGMVTESLELTAELSAEAPDYNDDWPSVVQVTLSGQPLCQFVLAGDFGAKRGVLTPHWWRSNQYGVQKRITLNPQGVFVDGVQEGAKTIADFDLSGPFLRLRFSVESASCGGGLTIYGKGFGNYPQDIECKIYYVPSLQNAQ